MHLAKFSNGVLNGIWASIQCSAAMGFSVSCAPQDICDVNFVTNVLVHKSAHSEGIQHHVIDADSILWLHMHNLYRIRSDLHDDLNVQKLSLEDVKFWWPEAI